MILAHYLVILVPGWRNILAGGAEPFAGFSHAQSAQGTRAFKISGSTNLADESGEIRPDDVLRG
jgi:hypothetical protein